MRLSKLAILFLLLIVADGLIYYLSQLLITPEILLEEFTRYLDYESAATSVNKSQTTRGLIIQYFLHLCFLFIKVITVSVALYFGLFLAKQQVTFKQILTPVVLCYPLFFISDLVQFFYFQFFQQDYTYFELNAFRLFSITQIGNLAGLAMQGKTAAFFNTFGILDVLFCWLLSRELNKESDKQVTATVSITFFTGLALWKSLLLLLIP